MGSLMKKTDYLGDFIKDEALHILGVGETWLVESDPISFVSLKGFSFIRSDVGGNVRKHGVGIYVSDMLIIEEVLVHVLNVINIKLVDCNLDT